MEKKMGDTILIIEDNDQNLYLMRFLLEKNGYTIIAAKSGIYGIQMADSQKPDAILLDIQLPGMNGYTVAAEIRKISHLAGVPIIAVTSYAMPGDREKALAAGANAYIEKPINPETFVSQVREYISGSCVDHQKHQ
jgi:CheY-like chemotaxis protein